MLLALMLAGALAAPTLSSPGMGVAMASPGGGGSAGAEAAAAQASGADVAVPTVTGPVTGGTHGKPFLALSAELRERYGYVEEEYFIEGEATAYAPDGELGEDGRWSVTEGSKARYKTRILVRRPADVAEFDGSVFAEWFNVTGGIDFEADFSLGHHEILRSGSVYVGVSAQAVGVNSLKSWETGERARYASLAHPGDQYSYDIFSQAAQAIRSGEVDVLGGATAEQIIGMGESQSGARMAAYVNGVHPVAGVYDGFLVHSRGGGGAPLGQGGFVLGEGVARVRDDLDVPVLQFETETDLFGPLGFHRARQEDTDRLRTWEVAGTAHADQAILDYNAEMAREIGGGSLDLAAQCGSINQGPQAPVLRAAIAALRAWVVDGEPPPEAPPLEVEGDAIVRDERGIARGGIRTPAVEAPISVLTGEAAPGGSVLCMLFGQTIPFDAATLAELYPTHQDYVDAVTESAEEAVDAGFLLPVDADDVIAAAEEAPVPE
jgi:hypothetical protein